MPEPASNGAGSGDIGELRELLVGPELKRLSALESRWGDPVTRSGDIAEVLPEAIRGAKGKALREALEPVFEKAFESSVRKHPKELADAIFPVIGPAIRKSIAASIAEFAETLNQIVEKSISIRAIQWRVEALVTGKQFSQILLARSLLYSVEQVFLIHRKSGLLLQHVAAKNSVLKDADMISGMLTAIQDFFSDSFTEGGQDLETVDAGRFKLWIQYGSKALVVGAVSGTAPAELKNVFRNAIDTIHQTHFAELDRFRQEDVAVFEPVRPVLEACLLGQSAPGRTRSPWVLWTAAALFLLLFVGFFWYRARQQNRWDQYFASVKQQPGLVITGIEKRSGGWLVTGLKDPLAPAPAREGAEYRWLPYYSLDTPFATERDFQTAKEQLEGQLIRFDAGSSRLASGEARRVDEAATAIGKVLRLKPASRIVVTGRADEVGSAATNDTLSLDRAKRALEALVSQGVAAERLSVIGVGNTQPLRRGVTDWDRQTNRSVSFKVE